MRKKSFADRMHDAVVGLARFAATAGNAIPAERTLRSYVLGGYRKSPTLKRNRTDSPSNRGIIAQRKANKVARRARVFNAQRARGAA